MMRASGSTRANFQQLVRRAQRECGATTATTTTPTTKTKTKMARRMRDHGTVDAGEESSTKAASAGTPRVDDCEIGCVVCGLTKAHFDLPEEVVRRVAERLRERGCARDHCCGAASLFDFLAQFYDDDDDDDRPRPFDANASTTKNAARDHKRKMRFWKRLGDAFERAAHANEADDQVPMARPVPTRVWVIPLSPTNAAPATRAAVGR